MDAVSQPVHQQKRYWAMRTARNTSDQRTWLYEEMCVGRLRQGWSYDERQNLKVIASRWTGTNWAEVDPETKELQDEAWPNLPMLGNAAPTAVLNRMNIGDVVLVPNTPINGAFSLFEIVGDYDWDVSSDPRASDHGTSRSDFASMLPVKVLLTNVSKNHPAVSGRLIASLRTPMRLWSLDAYRHSIEELLKQGIQGFDASEIGRRDPIARAHSIIESLIASQSDFSRQAVNKLFDDLAASNWEKVLQAALTELSFIPEIEHTGGPNEQGRDLEFLYSNPLLPEPLIVAVQVKDWSGIAGTKVIEQLNAVVERYRSNDRTKRSPGYLAAIVLAVTNAEASAELQKACAELSSKEKIPVEYVGKDQLMKLVVRGLLRRVSLS